MKKGHGYEIYQHYINIFPKVTMRSIYYHLKKGVALEEIKVHKIQTEKGDYSWGNTAEKIYYELGKNAELRNDNRVKGYFEKKKK